jgi:hypothetical protein
MTQKNTARSVVVRVQLRFHQDIDPGIYELINNTPEGARGELLHALLTRTAAPAMGLAIKIPAVPVQAQAASPHTPPGTVASKSALAPSATALAVDTVVKDDKPTRTLADLGIKSTADWADAFNYSTPPP